MEMNAEERMNQIRGLAEPLLKVSGMKIESLIEQKGSVGGDQLILFILTTKEKVVCVHIDFKSKIVFKGRCYDEQMLQLMGRTLTPEDKAVSPNDDLAIGDVMMAIKSHFFKIH